MSAATELKPQHDIISYLQGVSLFADIKGNDVALQTIAGLMKTQSFPVGQNILVEGNAGAEMYMLNHGLAAVWKQTPGGDEYKVALLHGEKHISFGESGLVEGEQRTATIRTETVCECLVLERAAFERYSQQHPDWALPIYRRIATNVMGRLRKTNNDMLLLYNALVAEIRGR